MCSFSFYVSVSFHHRMKPHSWFEKLLLSLSARRVLHLLVAAEQETLKGTKYKSVACALASSSSHCRRRDQSSTMRNTFGLALFGYCNVAGVFAANVQLPGLRLPPGSQSHQNAVKDIFLTSYNAYKWVRIRSDSTAYSSLNQKICVWAR